MTTHDCARMKLRLAEDAKAFVLATLTDPDLDLTQALLDIGECPTCLPVYEETLRGLVTDPEVAPLLAAESRRPRILIESLCRLAESGYSGPHAEELAAILAIDDRLVLTEAGFTDARVHAIAERAAAAACAQPSRESPSLLVLAAGALRERLLASVRRLGRYHLSRLVPDGPTLEAFLGRLERSRWEIRPAHYGASEAAEGLLEATLRSVSGAPSTCSFRVLKPIDLVRTSASEAEVAGLVAPDSVLDPEKEWLLALYTDQDIFGFKGLVLPFDLKMNEKTSRLEGQADPELRLPLCLQGARVPLVRADWRTTWKAELFELPPRRHGKRG